MKAAIYAGALIAGLLFGLTMAQGNQTKANYKVTRLSPNDVGISCLNGGDPTGHKVGDVLILSCGQ